MIAVQTSLGKDPDPISKVTSARRLGGISQVVEDLPRKYKALSAVEHLPSKHKALSSNPNATKKNKRDPEF
jgi:hypothetical protein